MSGQTVRARERVPTGRRGRPSKSMIAAAMERPFCAYLHKICLNNRLEGHKYCIDHIMNDKTAPFRQCTYVHSVTGRRCVRAAHKVDRRASPLCQYHRSLRFNAQQPPAALTLDDDSSDPRQTLLEDLAHHMSEPGSARPESRNTFWIPKPDGSAVPSSKLVKTMAKYSVQRQAEEANAPLEMPTMEEIAARHNNADSDTESVDNNLDMFKHAQVFTEEELTRTLRDKMIKLRRCYIEQYGHIQYVLKEKRLKYIQAQRLEDELYGDSFSYRNCWDSPDYVKLRSMLRYHKTFGQESLLQEQAKKRKFSRPPPVGPHSHPNAPCHAQIKAEKEPSVPSVTINQHGSQGDSDQLVKVKVEPTGKEGGDIKQQLQEDQRNEQRTQTQSEVEKQQQARDEADVEAKTKSSADNEVHMPSRRPSIFFQSLMSQSARENVCIFSRTAHACDKPSLPLSPYCKSHILYDAKQVLFRPCAGGMPPCLTPVVSYTRKNRCWLHLS